MTYYTAKQISTVKLGPVPVFSNQTCYPCSLGQGLFFIVYIFYQIFIFFVNITRNIKSILSNIIELPQVSQ